MFGKINEKAKNQALTEHDICNNFSKNVFFSPTVFVQTQNAFLTKAQLNNFRRNVYEKITQILTQNNNKKLYKTKIDVNVETKAFEDFEITENSSEIYHNKNVTNTRHLIYHNFKKSMKWSSNTTSATIIFINVSL